MTTRCYIVSSAIATSDVKFHDSAVRSSFSHDERFRQTIYTLDSIRNQDKSSRIYLVDCSINDVYDERLQALKHTFNNFYYISMRKTKRSVADICSSHWHKSYCEALQMKTFLQAYKEDLSKFEFIYKLSGRYTFDLYRQYPDPDKLLFKKPLVFDWQPGWDDVFSMIDYRKEENHNLYYSYASGFFGYGAKYIDIMLDFYNFCMEITNDPNKKQYNMDSLLYYYMRKHRDKIDHRNWTLMGFNGSTGWFQRF